MSNVEVLKKRVLIYSLLFATAFVVVFFNFYIKGLYFFSNGSDGMTQYMVAFKYLGNFYRELISNFFTGKLVVPQYDIYIGEGNDILNTFCYYGFGDPLEMLSIFFRGGGIYFGYNIVTTLRLYLVGLSFIFYATYRHPKNDYNTIVILGSMIYTFNMQTVGLGVITHQQFLNAYIYLPLIIMGVDKIYNNEKSTLYIITVFLITIWNFYFLWMIGIVTFIYVNIKFLNTLNKKAYIRIVVGTIIAFLMSAFLFLPVIGFVLNDSRITALSVPSHLLMSSEQLVDNIVAVFLPINWHPSFRLRIGLPFLVVPFLISKFLKSSIKYKVVFVISIVLFFMPAFWKFINCMSYESDRFSFIIIFLVTTILIEGYEDFKSSDSKFKIVILIASIFLYIIVRYLYLENYSDHHYLVVINDIANIIITLLLLTSINDKNLNYIHRGIITLIVFILVFNLRYIMLCDSDNSWENLVANQSNIDNVDINLYSSAKKLIDNDEGFHRVSGKNLDSDRNRNILLGVPSTQYYWTLVNSSISKFRKKFGFIDIAGSVITDYNYWTIPNELASVDYIFDNGDDNLLPYNYGNKKIIDNYIYYRNKDKLDLVYFYDNYITEADVEKENVSTLQINMLNSAIVNKDYNIQSAKKNKSVIIQNDKYTLISGNNASIDNNNKITINKDGGYVILSFNRKNKSEAFLELKNLNVYDLDGIEIYDDLYPYNNVSINIFKDKIISGFLYYSIYSRERKHNFTLRLGYQENKIDDDIYIITFGKKGIYTYDDLVLSQIDFAGFDDSINKLKTISLESFKFGDNEFVFNVTSEKDGLACISIPYSKGFKAFVNGKETKLYNVNYKNMAVEIDKGDSVIELYYERPYRIVAYLISLLGIFSFIVFRKFDVKKEKYN